MSQSESLRIGHSSDWPSDAGPRLVCSPSENNIVFWAMGLIKQQATRVQPSQVITDKQP